MKRRRDKTDKHIFAGYQALTDKELEVAARHFRAAKDPLGIALTAYYSRSWERAVNKALAALSIEEPGSEDEAVALKVLALASQRLGSEPTKGSAQQRREAVIKRAQERLGGVDWRRVHRQLRKLAHAAPGVFGPLASARMGRMLMKKGLQIAVDLVLAGDYHRAACIGDDLRRIDPTSVGVVAEFSLCPHCLEEWTEGSVGEPGGALMQTLAKESIPMLLEFDRGEPKDALILGVSALHLAEYLAHKGQDIERILVRALWFCQAATPSASLPPDEIERWTACIAFHRGRLLELQKDEAGALALLDQTASGSVAPWNEMSQEAADRIHRYQVAEARRQRAATLREEWEKARQLKDDAAELTALTALVTEVEADLSQLERFARLRAEASDPGWTETVAVAVRQGSRDEYLLRRLAEEAVHRHSEGNAREALGLFRLARRIGQLPRETMSAYAAVLASLGRQWEAGRAYEALGRDEPERFLDSARCFLAAGEQRHAIAAVQALFMHPEMATLWEDGLRLIESSAPPVTLRVLAGRILEKIPNSAMALTIKTHAETEEFRLAVEDRDQKWARAQEAAHTGHWREARDLIAGVPEQLRDGELWSVLAQAHEALDEAEASLRCYERLPPTASSLAGRVRSLGRLGRYSEARDTLRQILADLDQEEEPKLGDDPNIMGLWAEVRGNLREAANRIQDEQLLRSLIELAREREDVLAELEALAYLVSRRPAYDKELISRVRALEDRLPLREKARFVRGRFPTLVLCDTNVLLSRVVQGESLPEELKRLGQSQSTKRFESLRSSKEEAAVAVTDTVARELRSLLLYQRAIQDDEEAVEALEAVMQRADELVSELNVSRVADVAPHPPPEYAERVRSFYQSMGPRLRKITKRKVSRQPERKAAILRRRGVSRKKPGHLPMPEAVDQRLLAEAASLSDGPLPGFGAVGILSDDTDFRSFAQEIERTFGVRIC